MVVLDNPVFAITSGIRIIAVMMRTFVFDAPEGTRKAEEEGCFKWTVFAICRGATDALNLAQPHPRSSQCYR